jgi:dCMP deaminase
MVRLFSMPVTDRPTKYEYLMRVAFLTAERSTCERLKVGAVFADPSLETFVVGYNGGYKGGPNKCRGNAKLPGGCGCIHAEVNAVAKANRGPKYVFLTHSPCVVCSALLVNADVRQVFFGQYYRDDSGLDLLREARIATNHCPI